MKNKIEVNGMKLSEYLFPTDDASEIFSIGSTLFNGENIIRKEDDYDNLHLYLCSTREIKERDYIKSCDAPGATTQIYKYELPQCSKWNKFMFEKIEFTNDSKLIADGVPALPEKAYFHIRERSGEFTDSFLEVFCKQYNQKQSADIKGVDMEIIFPDANEINKYLGNSIDEWQKSLIRSFYNWIRPKIKINQSLKLNVDYSLEDMKKAYLDGKVNMEEVYEGKGMVKMKTFEEYIQSLTPSKQEREIGMYVEMEKDYSESAYKNPYTQDAQNMIDGKSKIKLKDGQPIIYFK